MALTNSGKSALNLFDVQDDFSKYEKMRDRGLDASKIYLETRIDGKDPIMLIRMLRRVFTLSLVEAKEVKVKAEGLANSLEEYQERFIPALESAFNEINEIEESENASSRLQK